MKKVLAALLALAMILSFAACGNKDQGNGEPVWDGPELVRNPQIDLGENLPSFVMTGEYCKEEISEEQAAEGLIEYYTALNPKVNSLCVYRVPNNHASIMNRMEYEEYYYHYEEQQLTFAEFDALVEPNDYHYGYYVALEEGTEESDPNYLINYIFLDGEDFVKVVFVVPAYAVQFEELGIQFWVPYEMDQVEETEAEIENGILCKFECDSDKEFANTSAYVWDATGKDLSGLIPWYGERYDVTVQYFYDYPVSESQIQKCLYLKFFETVDGVRYMDESFVTIIDGTALEINFKAPEEEALGLKQQMSVAPMMWSIEPIKAE